MANSAALYGDYVDLRFIKTRKVCQVIIEIPIEQGSAFVEAFGTPNPATGVPVGLARLDPNAKSERKGGKLAQKAGIMCNEAAFAEYVRQNKFDGNPVEYVYEFCQVTSRAHLDHDEAAARKFRDLELSYNAWVMVEAA